MSVFITSRAWRAPRPLEGSNEAVLEIRSDTDYFRARRVRVQKEHDLGLLHAAPVLDRDLARRGFGDLLHDLGIEASLRGGKSGLAQHFDLALEPCVVVLANRPLGDEVHEYESHD